MSRAGCALVFASFFQILAGTVAAAQEAPPADRTEAIRVFLDCKFSCDETYLRQEMTIVNWVRDRTVADVHVLVTTQETGGGGREYTVKFIGQDRFVSVEQTLRYFASPTSSPDDIRRGIAEVLKRGLVRYISETSQASRVTIAFAPETSAAAAAVKDPWNLWVFRTTVGGNMNGESSSRGRSVRASGSANRTTEAWRLSFSTNGNYRESTFDLSETDTFTSVSRNVHIDAQVVKSLTPHWSAALLANAQKSTFLNYDLRTRVAPGVEYDIFPYAQSTRRALRNYNVVAGKFPADVWNLRNSVTNLTEIIADAARSDDSGDYRIRIFTIGMGSLVRMRLGTIPETSESVLMRLANDIRSPDFDAGQVEGKYYFAATAADLGPVFQTLQAQIIRLSK